MGDFFMSHTHWEFESECPQCGQKNQVSCPVGEKIVVVHCVHCTHSYDYVHLVTEHKEIQE